MWLWKGVVSSPALHLPGSATTSGSKLERARQPASVTAYAAPAGNSVEASELAHRGLVPISLSVTEARGMGQKEGGGSQDNYLRYQQREPHPAPRVVTVL
jgi:hypothetical protein